MNCTWDDTPCGRQPILWATFPWPLPWSIRDDQVHMRRFLQNLERSGLMPEVVITDGSELYPEAVGRVVAGDTTSVVCFHVIKDINKHALDAVKRLRRCFLHAAATRAGTGVGVGPRRRSVPLPNAGRRRSRSKPILSTNVGT